MARRRIRHAEIVQLFAERLKEARRSRNMTQAELARKALVPSSYISDLEKAKTAPGIDLVDRLAKAMEMSVVDLFQPLLRLRHRQVCETKRKDFSTTCYKLRIKTCCEL